jgi:hypothetical protein
MTIGQNMSRFATSKIRESPGGAGTDPLICPRPLGPDLLQSRPRPASCQLTNNGCIDNSQKHFGIRAGGRVLVKFYLLTFRLPLHRVLPLCRHPLVPLALRRSPRACTCDRTNDYCHCAQRNLMVPFSPGLHLPGPPDSDGYLDWLPQSGSSLVAVT